MTDITLISGSTLGGAEYVAEHLAEKLEEAGFTPKTWHGAALSDLPLTGVWLIVTSTHGAGDLPDNLQSLYKAINTDRPDLSTIRYGAIGIGNQEYDLFCGAIKQIDQLLRQCGAHRLGERLEIDVLQHEIPEDLAEQWLRTWIPLLAGSQS